MSASNEVRQFVREALVAGRSRAEIKTVLAAAGWSEHEISDGLAAFAEVEFTPPVPRPRRQVTARDAFIYMLLFAALAFTAGYLVSLIHAVLDIALPDIADNEYAERRATRRLHWAIGVLVVATPVFVWMTVHTSRLVAKDSGHLRSPVRRWLTYLALLVAASIFFGDATYVIYTFLKGEMTIRFALKALTVAVIAAAVFGFYLGRVEETKNDR